MTMSTISVKAIDVAERMTDQSKVNMEPPAGTMMLRPDHPLPTAPSIPCRARCRRGPCLDRLHVLVRLGHPQATVGHDHLTRLEALGDDPDRSA